jgi:hypothetical protein
MFVRKLVGTTAFVRKLVGTTAAILFVGAMAFARTTSSPQQNPAVKGDNTTPMTVVGCLIKEADYRSAHGLGKGGVGGMRTGSDFVLVDATTVSAGAPAPAGVSAGGSCSEKGTGQAYRMAGKTEGKLKPFVGRYVEITGRFEHAHDANAAAGATTPHLPPEIVVTAFREPTASAVASAETPAPPATTAPAPANTAPAATAPANTAPAVGTSGHAATTTAPARRMPKTASDEPLIALLGVICLMGSLGVRLLRRRVV